MLSHKHRCIYIHVPKTAGQSIEMAFLSSLGLNWKNRGQLLLRKNESPDKGPPRLAHLVARDYVRLGYCSQIQFDEYFKFGLVRNPWDRAVSLYKYLGCANNMDFASFAQQYLPRELFRKMFWFVMPQFEYFCDHNGDSLLDHVGRFENIREEYLKVQRKLHHPIGGLPHRNMSRKMVSGYFERITQMLGNKHKDNRDSKNYRSYYDSESIDAIGQLYQVDIEKFGYEF